MNVLYGSPVFDEWAIVMMGGERAQLAAYEGPRLEQFRSRFVADTRDLRELLAGQTLNVGDFAFAPAAEGTAYDACVRLGTGAYAFFNDTVRSMESIRAEEGWREAQKPFAEMTEAFRRDPLQG